LQQPSSDVPANHVAMVAQAGYQMHDRVVRPAQVIVSSGPAEG
jgi:molecular chaperone GrpE